MMLFGYCHDNLFYLFQATNFRVRVSYISLSESLFVALISHRCQPKIPMVIAYLHVYWKMSLSFAYSDE
jgi:hypothetical protein